jgi:hypothetical protein
VDAGTVAAGVVAVAVPTPTVLVAVGLFATGDVAVGVPAGLVAVAVVDTTAVVEGMTVGVVVASQGMITLVSARVWFGPPLACEPTAIAPLISVLTVALKSSLEVVPGS